MGHIKDGRNVFRDRPDFFLFAPREFPRANPENSGRSLATPGSTGGVIGPEGKAEGDVTLPGRVGGRERSDGRNLRVARFPPLGGEERGVGTRGGRAKG